MFDNEQRLLAQVFAWLPRRNPKHKQKHKHKLSPCLAAQANARKTDKTTLNRSTCLVPEDATSLIAAVKTETDIFFGLSPVESFVYKRRPMSKNCGTFWWRSSQFDKCPQHEVDLDDTV